MSTPNLKLFDSVLGGRVLVNPQAVALVEYSLQGPKHTTITLLCGKRIEVVGGADDVYRSLMGDDDVDPLVLYQPPHSA